MIEGAGANACEYMTGGVTVILGEVGKNFGAGMTGGMAFILDTDDTLPRHANPESIVWQRLESSHWEERLLELIGEHAKATDSPWAHSIIDDWDHWREQFWQVCPKEMIDRLEHPLSDEEEIAAAE